MVLLLGLQTPALTQQPTTIEFTEYQRVQHALPDGTPDLKAPDNFYIRVQYTWLLLLDSDTVRPDENGTRHLHLDGFADADRIRYRQEGRPSKAMVEKFTEVRPLFNGKPEMKTGGTTRGDFDMDVPKGQRHVDYYVHAVVEKVETHSEGRHRTTRTTREAHWSVNGGGAHEGEVMIPRLESTVGFEPGEHVRPGKPIFGYKPVSIPNWEEF